MSFDIDLQKAKQRLRDGEGPIFESKSTQELLEEWEDQSEEFGMEYNNMDHFKYWLTQIGYYDETRYKDNTRGQRRGT